jgi:hypothetical protein
MQYSSDCDCSRVILQAGSDCNLSLGLKVTYVQANQLSPSSCHPRQAPGLDACFVAVESLNNAPSAGSSVCGIGAALFVTNAVEMHIIAAFLAMGRRLAL